MMGCPSKQSVLLQNLEDALDYRKEIERRKRENPESEEEESEEEN